MFVRSYCRLPNSHTQRSRVHLWFHPRLLVRQIPLELGRRQVLDSMDGLPWVVHVHSVLQRGRVVEHHEAQLEVFETGLTVDKEHLEIRYEVFVYGTPYLDHSSLRCLHYGEPSHYNPYLLGFQRCLTQVDKLFNPFTLLAGPCLVLILIGKSTKPVDQGGYHLPWWCVTRRSLETIST